MVNNQGRWILQYKINSINKIKWQKIQCIINSTPTSSKSTPHSVARLLIKSEEELSAAIIKSWPESTKSRTAAKSNAPPNPKKKIPNYKLFQENQKNKFVTNPILSKRKLNHKNHNLITTNNNLFGFNNLLSIEGEKRIKPSYKYWP